MKEEANAPRAIHGVMTSRTPHLPSQAVPTADSYPQAVPPTTSAINTLFIKIKSENTHLSRSLNQRIPFNLRHESPQKIRVELRLAQCYLDIFKCEWEVVGVTAFCVAGEQVMCYEADHWKERQEITTPQILGIRSWCHSDIAVISFLGSGHFFARYLVSASISTRKVTGLDENMENVSANKKSLFRQLTTVRFELTPRKTR